MIGFFFGKLIDLISQLYLNKNCVSYRRKKDVKPMNLPILSEYYIKMTFPFRGLALFR